jgi:acetyl-CoA C-acetyltransferase
MKDAVIVSAVRTPIGAFGGGLRDVSLKKLGAIIIEEALTRARVEKNEVDEVIMGNIFSAGEGMHPVRQASVEAGLPVQVPSMMVNKMCGSGLKAVSLAAQSILLDDADVVVAGGMENMSRAAYVTPGVRWGVKMGHGQLYDTMIGDGLWCSLTDCHMGNTAENLAAQYGITRDEMDEFSMRSHQKAAEAWNNGIFQQETVTVAIPQRKGNPKLVDMDEHIKSDTSMETLASLRPAFQKDGKVTAGNSSGVNDGSAGVVVMSDKEAQRRGITPMAVIRGTAWAGVEPHIMGIGPAPAVRKVMSKTGLNLNQIGLIELNEAFAAQSLAVGKELEFDWDKVNVNGGAVALGHPVGASGARVLVTLLYEMQRRRERYGLAALCIGGGQGIAMVLENLTA